MNLKKIGNELKIRYSYSEKLKVLKRELKSYPHFGNTNAPILLCQVVEDVFFLHRIIHFVIAYIKLNNTPYRLRWVIVRKNFYTLPIKRRIINFLFNNIITDYFWLSLYKTLGGTVALRYNSYFRKDNKSSQWAKETFNSIKTKDDLIGVALNDITVGDLVYDTYLRFKPAPTVDISDKFLIELLEWTFELANKIETYLSNHSVEAVATTYTSYIHHGLLVRISNQKQIKVFALGAGNQIVLSPTADFPYHVRNFHKYKNLFSTIENKEEALKIGHQLIASRIEGKKDAATSYMNKTAYHENLLTQRVLNQNEKQKAIIMAHDFYDSPHVYGQMLFPDFYEWVKFLFEAAIGSTYDVYYKPHPNGMAESNLINENLRKAYPHITFLPPTISNLQLIHEGISVAFTVHGTVAHEFSFLGVPVISAAANPHSAYKFNIFPATKQDLAEYISGRKKPILDNSDVAEFCYIHNFRYIDESLRYFPVFSEKDNLTPLFDVKTLNIRVDSMINAIKRHSSI